MTMKSVTINQSERIGMKQRITRDYNKLIVARNDGCNAKFGDDFSLEVYKRVIDSIPKDVLPYVPYKEAHSQLYLTSVTFVDEESNKVNIKYLSNPNSSHPSLEASNQLQPIPTEKLQEYEVHERLYPASFTKHQHEYAAKITLTPEEIEKVEKHNEAIQETIGELDDMKNHLLSTISKLKSTKMFFDKVPFLENILPDSVKRKLKEANEVPEEEKTKEDKLKDAADMLAAAALMD